MTVPTVNTAEWIIKQGLKDAGRLGRGQTPTSDDYAEGLGYLNEIINELQTQGIKLWLQTDLPVTLTAGTALYTFGAAGTVAMTKPLRVIEAYYSDANGIRRPLNPMSWNDYNRLSQLTQQGAINSYFVDKQVSLMKVFLWLVPDTTAALGQVHLLLQQQVGQFTSIATSTMFPLEWARALRWSFARERSVGQPASVEMRCVNEAREAVAKLEDWDVEDAPTQFQPDPRGQYATRGFR